MKLLLKIKGCNNEKASLFSYTKLELCKQFDTVVVNDRKNMASHKNVVSMSAYLYPAIYLHWDKN